MNNRQHYLKRLLEQKKIINAQLPKLIVNNVKRQPRRNFNIIRQNRAKLVYNSAPKRAPNVAPKRAPCVAPKRAPCVAPKRAPCVAPKRAPNVAPKRIHNVAPKRIHNVAPKRIHNVAPKRAPNVAPKRAPNVAPKRAPKRIHNNAPKFIHKRAKFINKPIINNIKPKSNTPTFTVKPKIINTTPPIYRKISNNIRLLRKNYIDRTNYIITRFSIFDYNYKGFILTKTCKNIDEYKQLLFNKDRLDFKFFIFENITLKSILNQANKKFIYLIYSSKLLPDEYKEKLNSLVNNIENIKLIYVENFDEMYKSMDEIIIEPNYTTSRLDDDDRLDSSFINVIKSYNNCSNIEILSFPYGSDFVINENKEIINRNAVSIKNIAIGLTAFDRNIYYCGNHSRVHNFFKTYYDLNISMYGVCCSEYCDSKRK